MDKVMTLEEALYGMDERTHVQIIELVGDDGYEHERVRFDGILRDFVESLDYAFASEYELAFAFTGVDVPTFYVVDMEHQNK